MSNLLFYGYVDCSQFTIYVCCAWQVSQTPRSRHPIRCGNDLFLEHTLKEMAILHFIYSLIVFSFGPFVLTSELLAKIPEVCTITESIYQTKTQKCLLLDSIWIQTASIRTWMYSPWNQQAKLEFFGFCGVFRARNFEIPQRGTLTTNHQGSIEDKDRRQRHHGPEIVNTICAHPHWSNAGHVMGCVWWQAPSAHRWRRQETCRLAFNSVCVCWSRQCRWDVPCFPFGPCVLLLLPLLGRATTKAEREGIE